MSELLMLLVFLGSMALTSFTVWSRKETWMRVAAVLVFLGMTPALAGVSFFSLSHPRPVTEYSVPCMDCRVLSMYMRQDMAIWLWLETADGPRYWVLPWDNELANNLQGAADQEEGDGTPYLFLYDEDTDNVEFDTIPVLPDPPKTVPPPPAVFDQHPGGA